MAKRVWVESSRSFSFGGFVATMGVLAWLLLAATGCRGLQPTPTQGADANAGFQIEPVKVQDQYAPPEAVEELSSQVPDRYLLGSGDVLKVSVWHRPEVSDDNVIVAPDGCITLNRIGIMDVKGMTVEQLSEVVAKRLTKYYETPEVSISIVKFNNNKAFVLGRVTSPGVVHFAGTGTLMEALALAGGLPVIQKEAFLTRCSIIRGKNTVIWIDLRELLNNGNTALNARIQNNDIIFIPESEDELVYVMGEVKAPGAIRLKSQLTFLSALMMAGGPTFYANTEKAYLVRFAGNEKGQVMEIDMKRMIEHGDGSQNYLLKANDAIYIPQSGSASFDFAMQRLLTPLAVFTMGVNTLETFGVMQELRREFFGQQGFVTTTGGTSSSK